MKKDMTIVIYVKPLIKPYKMPVNKKLVKNQKFEVNKNKGF